MILCGAGMLRLGRGDLAAFRTPSALVVFHPGVDDGFELRLEIRAVELDLFDLHQVVVRRIGAVPSHDV